MKNEKGENKAKLIYSEEYQDSIEQQIEEEKDSGVYTEDQMLIKENPYGTNTLSLYVCVLFLNVGTGICFIYSLGLRSGDCGFFANSCRRK